MGIIIDADVTLFEVGRLLKYLSQRKEKKESHKAKKNELPITDKGKERERANGQVSLAKCKYDITLNTHTLTHTFFQNIVFSVSLALSLDIIST